MFIGETQPHVGKYAFCHKLIEKAHDLAVERVVTFAAMATPMHPHDEPRLIVVTTNQACLSEVRDLELPRLQYGQIGGFNGVLLGATAEAGLLGICLRAEIPHIFCSFHFSRPRWQSRKPLPPLPYQTRNEGVGQSSKAMARKFREIIKRVQEAMTHGESVEDEIGSELQLFTKITVHLDNPFRDATKDRVKAYELKRELVRLNVFKEFDDRFLDSFEPSHEEDS